MAHSISAAILKGTYDSQQARQFELPAIELGEGLTLFPLHAGHCDAWSEKLDISDPPGDWRPLLDVRVVHYFMSRLAPEPFFAVMETDYFGGAGDQAAVVYKGAQTVMPRYEGETGPINNALKLLGVRRSRSQDEFDTVGLGRFRSFDELFRAYWG